MNIAWIGTGVMGAPMALHLADKKYTIKAFNRTHAKAKSLEPKVIATSSIPEFDTCFKSKSSTVL